MMGLMIAEEVWERTVLAQIKDLSIDRVVVSKKSSKYRKFTGIH